MLTETLTDFSATIRAEIERDITNLKVALRHKAQYIKLGYLVNSHHGRALYSEGDTIGGTPLTIDRTSARTIEVGANNIRHVETVTSTDADGDIVEDEREWFKNHYKRAIW